MRLLERDASDKLLQVRELATDAGMLASVASIDLLLADCLGVVVGPAAALPYARRCAELAGRVCLRGLQAMALLWVASGHAEAGRLRDMDTCVAQAVELAPDSPEVVAVSSCIRALPALFDHDLGRARDLLDEGIAVLGRHASAHPSVYWGCGCSCAPCSPTGTLRPASSCARPSGAPRHEPSQLALRGRDFR